MVIRNLSMAGLLVAAFTGCDQPGERPATPAEERREDALERREAEDRAKAVPPDNTRRNVLDGATEAKVPTDQSEDPADIAITAEIRREILKVDNLSTNADNVKIITADGKVTLRGVVASKAEREAIQTIAVRVAGKDHVDNQLEIQPGA